MAIGSERPARIVVEAPSGKLESDLKNQSRLLRSFSDRNSRVLNRPPKRQKSAFDGVAGGIGKGIARIGIGFAEKIGSGFADVAAQGVNEVVDFERALTRFQISGGDSTESITRFRMELTKTAKDTGIARNEILSGSSAYVALTGDAAGARSSIGLFSKVAMASGASMNDIATTAASLRDNLKIDPKDFEGAFSALIVQGKAGAIELKDLAGELSGVAPQFGAFSGGSGVKGLATLGAALQAGRKGFSSASEAATGLRSLIVAINRNAGKIGKNLIFKSGPGGIKQLRGFREIIDGISNSRLAKDPTRLTKAFGSDEAKRFYDQLVQNRDLFDQLEAKSSEGGAVAADALTYQQSAAGKLDAAMERLKLSVAEAFTPERIRAFASAVQGVAELLAQIVGAISSISEFSDVREKKNRNEAQLAAMGEYTGSNRDLQAQSNEAARRIELEDQRLAVSRREARAKRLVDAVGAGALTLATQSALPREPSGYSPSPSRQAAPPIPFLLPSQAMQQSRVVVQIDGNNVATAVKRASGARRNVGGR